MTYHTRMPAVLIETAFLSNPNDYALLTSSAWWQRLPKRWPTASPIGSPSRSVIGLFDSGLGGLTVLARVRERMPMVDVLFFADQAHVPYGDRTHAELSTLRANLARCDDDGVDAIVMACNTSCAVAERYGWPQTRVPIVDLIESAAIAVAQERFARIGIVATAATVGAGSYGRTIRARIPGVDVVEVAAPALVPLVEAGKIAGDEARAAVAEVVPHLPLDLDAVVLGCTHYPMLEPHFRAVLGDGVALVDPAVVQAQARGRTSGERARPRRYGVRYVGRFGVVSRLDRTNTRDALAQREQAHVKDGEKECRGGDGEPRARAHLHDRVRFEIDARPADHRNQHQERQRLPAVEQRQRDQRRGDPERVGADFPIARDVLHDERRDAIAGHRGDHQRGACSIHS